jgi:hypothetical protein
MKRRNESAQPATRACVYCGAPRATTRDHIPPKALFAPPRPADLVTVPCCQPCNTAFSRDDEYLRLVLVLRDEAYSHPDARSLIDPVIRGLSRADRPALGRAFAKTLRRVRLRSPAGLHFGTAGAYDVDLARLRRSVTRIIRGLYFDQYSTILPPTAGVRVWFDDDLVLQSAEDVAWMRQAILTPLLQNAPLKLGRGVMRVWHVADPAEPMATAWVVEFYGHARFLAITVPDATIAA